MIQIGFTHGRAHTAALAAMVSPLEARRVTLPPRMELTSTTNAVLQLVEKTTGLPVIVQADTSMRILAAIKIAQGTAPAHLLTYNPKVAANLNYAVCFQCGFALRIFQAPEADRYAVGSSYQGKKEAERLVNEHLRNDKGLNRDARLHIATQMYDGIIRQLRSMPIGLRVDEWLRTTYPDLAEEQKALTVQQLQENTSSLRPDVRRFTPDKVRNASVAMSAATAAYWSRTWSDPLPLVPYKSTGDLDRGLALLKRWDDLPGDPAADKQLIDAWGVDLGLNGWYEFLPGI